MFGINDLYLAGVIINTEVNLNFAWNEALRKLHILIKSNEHPFLKYDSYVDCSKLHKRLISEICDAIKKNPSIVIGNVSEDFLREVVFTILHAKTISVKDKKDFGFYKPVFKKLPCLCLSSENSGGKLPL